jgi:hypothetical protein
MGDYKVESNSLMNAQSGVPEFGGSKHSVRIKHREYLKDITGSTGFSVQAFNINPGLVQSFPWLSNVAFPFQQYKIHGLLFEFVSMSADALNSTNTALGTVIMATQYNSTLANFASKVEMEGYEFSCSTRPSHSLIHPVECSPAESPLQHLYIRGGAPAANSDLRMYDLGIFQLATVGMQAAATIGELWVTYDIEFFKPRVEPGGSYPGQFTRINNGSYNASTEPLGSIQTTPVGDLGVTISSTTNGWDTIFFPASITSGTFLVTVNWLGGSAANCSWNTPTYTNCTAQNKFALSANNNVIAPSGGTSNSENFTFEAVVSINGYSSSGSAIVISGSNTLPASPSTVSIYVVAIPSSEIFV